MTLNTTGQEYAEQSSTPSTPGTGNQKLYPKTDGNWYKLEDDATETPLGVGTTLAVINSSGATAAIGDVGYLDDAGEYQTTTTEALDATWCVVVTGGANGASIRVQTRGNAVVNYTGTAPAKDDYLVTSTTAGDAKAQSTMSPEIFAICTAAGSGGTVAVLLYTQTRFVPKTSSNFVMTLDNHSESDFVSVISGAPSATSVVYGAVSSGNEDILANIVSASLGKMRLHNTTRGTYRLIESVDTGTNTITTVSSPSDGWADTDAITIESQTVDSGVAGSVFFDIDLSQQTTIPPLARAVNINMQYRDSGTANEFMLLHPFLTYASSQQVQLRTQAGNVAIFSTDTVPLYERVFSQRATASGTGTITLNDLSLQGYHLASP